MSKYTTDSDDANFGRNAELMRFLCAIANELNNANELTKIDLYMKSKYHLNMEEIQKRIDHIET